ncbi:MAG TPA: class I SAM-dependent methyltransferase, partial [Halanaerobiales bacterium]|nr:class I SAM-dependent methyltransferase [Halanaerobiales bacterium]
YYNNNAEKYYKNTVEVDMSPLYKEFLKHIKENGHILDAGCGSGRDSLYFLKQGYEVTAIDGSEKLAKLSSELIDQEVKCMKFEDINYKEVFDGIWTCASLLHVKRKDIENILNRLTKALKLNGVLYSSFKYGSKEIYRNGRLFNYYDENSFKELINKFKYLEIIKLWKTEDRRKNRENEYWLNILLKKI